MTDIELSDSYDSVEDIATSVIEKTKEAQNCSKEELKDKSIPVSAIDEAEMPLAIENDAEISQEKWDTLRSQIAAEIQSRGYIVDGIF
jgi:hypothetical protein